MILLISEVVVRVGENREGGETHWCDGLARLKLTGDVKLSCSGRLIVGTGGTAFGGRDAVSATVKSIWGPNAKRTAL